MSRKILSDGLNANHEDPDDRDSARLSVLGKCSNRFADHANEPVMAIEVAHEKYLVPVSAVSQLLDAARRMDGVPTLAESLRTLLKIVRNHGHGDNCEWVRDAEDALAAYQPHTQSKTE